jgi:hypothetical protein
VHKTSKVPLIVKKKCKPLTSPPNTKLEKVLLACKLAVVHNNNSNQIEHVAAKKSL